MRPVCLHMIFLLLTLLYLIIWLKINLLITLKELLLEKALLTLHVMTEARFTSEKHKHIMHGLVKMYVMRWPFCWTTFLFDLVLSCIDKQLGFLYALIKLPWLPIYYCFVMRGTLWCLFLMITLVNVNAPVVATTSWWLHFSAPVVKGKKI